MSHKVYVPEVVLLSCLLATPHERAQRVVPHAIRPSIYRQVVVKVECRWWGAGSQQPSRGHAGCSPPDSEACSRRRGWRGIEDWRRRPLEVAFFLQVGCSAGVQEML